MRLLPFAVLALAAFSAHAEITTYDIDNSKRYDADFRVRVRQGSGEWMPVPVVPVKVDRVADARHNVETASMAWFDFSGEPVEVEVTSRKGAVEDVKIQPLSYGISAEKADSVVLFTLAEPRNLFVTVNGDIFHNLHLFANPQVAGRPTKKQIKKDKHLVYFGPGVHKLPGDTMRIPSNSTVYVDGAARVVGQLICDGVDNVRIYGRGEVHPAGRGEGVYVKNSRNIDIEGIIVTQLPVGGSDGVTISNVKSISSYGWGDGMNVFASDNVSYDRVFCRNSDDCHTVYATRKGFSGGCKNITMRNSALWADVAHPIMIGLHGNADGCDTIQNLRYENIDIVDHCENQIDYQGCFAINCGDNNLVDNVLFDDIRVEDFRKGQLVNIRIFYNKKYCLAPGAGIRNIVFKDVAYNGSGDNLSIIAGYDSDHKVENVVFENLTINGKKITDDMPGKPKWYKTGDFANMFIGEHVDNVVFK